jgi:peroxiredoxin
LTIPSDGDLAPTFEVTPLTGATRALEDLLEAGPVLLAFMKTECATCNLCFPFIESIWRHYQEFVSPEKMQLGVLAVSQSSEQDTRAFFEQHHLSFPCVLETDELAISRSYELETTPTLILLSGREKLRRDAETVEPQEGRRVLATMEGWDKLAFDTLNDQIAARVGALPADSPPGYAEAPDTKPG